MKTLEELGFEIETLGLNNFFQLSPDCTLVLRKGDVVVCFNRVQGETLVSAYKDLYYKDGILSMKKELIDAISLKMQELDKR